jgi:capsular polysaccharide export protein
MSLAKRKRPPPRDPVAEKPPEWRGRRMVRLASEPTLERKRQPDRWEPGFLRMPGLAPGRSLSYVVDGFGIYYDATAPSELEYYLQYGGWEDDELMARAETAMAALVRSGISLDNDPRRVSLGTLLPGGRNIRGRRGRIVVVDQPRSDSTIGLALASAAQFRSMLAYACAEHDPEDVVVVMDPGSAEPASAGHLSDRALLPAGVTAVHEPVTGASVLAEAREIYTVSAHLGFEAAMANVPVTCFGSPFYAGWGFTDDRLVPPRRSRIRSALEVFAAGYLTYSRYFDPYRGLPISFEDALEIAALSAERARENAVATLCVGFSAWKRPWLNGALGAAGHRPIVSTRAEIAPQDVAGAGRVVAWATRAPAGIERACETANVPYLRMEDGFIRSIGLGASLRTGASYVLDRSGMYYDATRPSDLETLLQNTEFDDALLARAARLREAIVSSGVSKYNVGAASMPALPAGAGPVVLVAGQVASDAAVRLGELTVDGNLGLIQRARERNPDAVIVYKPHPDVEAGLRPGRVPPKLVERYCDHVIRDVPAPEAIAAADRVEVATSLFGFEALLRGKPVATHGMPFYAGWGLTTDPGSPRRTRRLTLDELVAGALILYPRYVDPLTGLPCTPEIIVDRLAQRDPGLGRRTRSLEALLKEVWSIAFRRARRV